MRRTFFKKHILEIPASHALNRATHTSTKKKDGLIHFFFSFEFFNCNMCFELLIQLLKETGDAIPAINTVVQVTRHGYCLRYLFPWFLFILPKLFASSTSVAEAIWLQRTLAVPLQLQLSQQGELLQQPF